MSRCRGILLALAWIAAPAAATTWAETSISDPIDGAPCTVATPASMGSYVYEWPEKYDQVFFPVTAEPGIWSCASGFASVIGDAALSPGERHRAIAYLAGLPAPERQARHIDARLRRAAALYLLRDLDPERRALIHRILAYDFENLANQPGLARDHRQAALKIMLDRLAATDLPVGRHMEYLFVSAAYLREQGDIPRSDRLLAQLQLQRKNAADGEQAGYAAYLAGLVPQLLRIVPGGKLAPNTD
jgi:hypothetical protein